jgi:hypothetical protein
MQPRVRMISVSASTSVNGPSEGGRDGSNGWYSVLGCLVEVVVSPRYYRGAVMDELSLEGEELIVPLRGGLTEQGCVNG